MSKISFEDLKKIKENARHKMNLRSGSAKARITVHLSTCGIAAGARTIMNALLQEIENKGYTDVIVTASSCAGLCSREPMATVEYEKQPPVKYVDLDEKKALRILNEHALAGKIVKEFALASGSETAS